MSNQLHRRLAYRTGGTGTDTTSDSFWDSSDFSTAHVVSHMELYRKWMQLTGSGSSSSPYRLGVAYDSRMNPRDSCPDSLFLTGGTDPIIVFGSSSDVMATNGGYSGSNLYLSHSFRKHNFIGVGDRLASNVVSGNVSRWTSDPVSAHNLNAVSDYNNPRYVSYLCTGCVARDFSGVHWYFLQSGNSTGNFYKNVGYAPLSSSSVTYTPENHELPGTYPSAYQRVNIPQNYGVRILHCATPSGGYPLEAETLSMLMSTKEPGDYTYYSGTSTTARTSNTAVAFKTPAGNRQCWDFTLLALESGDYSPAGYFTNDAPISMQCVDSGQKMAFLSAISTNGQSLSFRSMTSPWDITTLSTTTTSRSMTDFQSEVCTALGTTSGWIQWIWFKFSSDGKKLIFLSNGGILVKFRLTNAYDLATMSLQTVVRLPAQVDMVSPLVKFQWSTYSISSYSGATGGLKQPIIGADIDPDGQSLILSVAAYRIANDTTIGPPLMNNIVQYRL